jgi:hypothetical protein
MQVGTSHTRDHLVGDSAVCAFTAVADADWEDKERAAMSKKPTPQTTPTKRRRTKAEREEHAEFARRSVVRKKAQGLFRANVWIPMDQNEYFQNLAAEARARHFSRLTPPVEDQAPPAKKRRAQRESESDGRQGKLPL